MEVRVKSAALPHLVDWFLRLSVGALFREPPYTFRAPFFFWRNKLIQIQSPTYPCSHSRGLHCHLRITFGIITPHLTCLIPACMPISRRSRLGNPYNQPHEPHAKPLTTFSLLQTWCACTEYIALYEIFSSNDRNQNKLPCRSFCIGNLVVAVNIRR